MQKLPTNIIQLIFAADISIWPILRLASKRFLEISKSDYVMKHIVMGLFSTNIYNNLIAFSKKRFVIYCTGYLPPIAEVRTFYGTFLILPVMSGFFRCVDYNGETVSPILLTSNFSEEKFIKFFRKYIARLYREDLFNSMRYGLKDYVAAFLNIFDRFGFLTALIIILLAINGGISVPEQIIIIVGTLYVVINNIIVLSARTSLAEI